MDIKGPLQRYSQVASVTVDTTRIMRSIEIIKNSGIEHEFRTTVVRSQIDVQDLRSIVRLIDKSSLYVLQTFVSAKTRSGSLLSESPNSPLELSDIREQLEKEAARIEIR